MFTFGKGNWYAQYRPEGSLVLETATHSTNSCAFGLDANWVMTHRSAYSSYTTIGSPSSWWAHTFCAAGSNNEDSRVGPATRFPVADR